MPSYADDAVLVLHLTVKVGESSEQVASARVGREWLLSWETSPNDRRSVVLQPVSRQGFKGASRTFEGCQLDQFSGLKGAGSNVADSLLLRCAR